MPSEAVIATSSPPVEKETPPHGYGLRFWAIIGTLSITFLLSALDISVISTALPSIVKDLGAGEEYQWIPTAYFLTNTAFQPLYGQAANIVGRRILILGAVSIFAIGSAVSGSAPNTAALIAGRTIQGIGGAGINVMIEILVCDLCPLRERAKYLGIINIGFAIAIALGPLIGGLMTDRVTWRWIFYMNLPIAGAALVLLFVFLRVQYRKDTSGRNILRRIDFGGNALLISSVIAILLALTYGGTLHPWGSWRTIVPLVLGASGLIAFLALQSTSCIPEPTMPLRMFANRTSLAGFALTFIHSILMFQITYYLPLYFQSIKNASPTASGVYMLPTSIAAMPFAIGAGTALSKLGKYKPIMFLGCICLSISFGLFSMLDASSTTAFWIGIQFLEAAGVGILLPTTLPAVQAPLADADTAVVTATWGFLRAFGGIWGISIPATVFNSRVNQLVPHRVQDPAVQRLLVNGGAYARASKDFIHSFDAVPALKTEVISVYTSGLRLTWRVGIGFSVLAFLTVFALKEVPMREHLETDFGLDAPMASDPPRDVEAGLSGSEQYLEPSNVALSEKAL
ncbi:MAG: hypothetical protein M1821_005030 [Bathelium mastoideum]|nr:MAG: hypothetical protein M1821_005030 [Bathelium mastoideum]